jgi:DNA-binding transcriptional MerR regulator
VEAARELTIDDLARQAGMTVRNVRAYRSRGLLPEPELRGRKGFYGPHHIARLELIRELREKGFNLEAIGQIVERSEGESAEQVLDFTRAIVAPLRPERPKLVPASYFAERWGDQLTPEIARKAISLGLVRQVSDDQWEIRSPSLDRAAQLLRENGIPLEAAMDIASALRRNASAVAREYVRLFTEHVWRPFDQAGRPKEDWPKVREALDRLQPLAGESLLSVFNVVMADAVAAAFEEEIARDASAAAEPSSE